MFTITEERRYDFLECKVDFSQVAGYWTGEDFTEFDVITDGDWKCYRVYGDSRESFQCVEAK